MLLCALFSVSLVTHPQHCRSLSPQALLGCPELQVILTEYGQGPPLAVPWQALEFPGLVFLKGTLGSLLKPFPLPSVFLIPVTGSTAHSVDQAPP